MATDVVEPPPVEPRSRAPESAADAREHARQLSLLRAAQTGDRRARDELVRPHLALVRSVALRYRGLGLPVEDLVQEGALGLLEAIDLFDETRGRRFSSYAHFRVVRAIRNALTEKARLVRLPKGVVERRRIVDRAEAEFLALHGGAAPTVVELAAATGLTPLGVREVRALIEQPLSVDAMARAGGSPRDIAVRDAFAPDPASVVIGHERDARLRRALRALSPRQRAIVARRAGLDAEPAATSAIAHDLGLSMRRTQTLEQDALYRLRAELDRPADETQRVA